MDAKLVLKQIGLKEHDGSVAGIVNAISISKTDLCHMQLFWFISLASNFTHFKEEEYTVWLLSL